MKKSEFFQTNIFNEFSLDILFLISRARIL